MDYSRGVPLEASFTPSDHGVEPTQQIPNTEIVNITELEANDKVIVWSRFNTPRDDRIISVEHHDDAIVIERQTRSIPEVAPLRTKVMRRRATDA